MYYVYVLCGEGGKLYTGYTADLKARIKAHNTGKVKTTKSGSYELVYYEAFKSEKDARKREKRPSKKVRQSDGSRRESKIA